MFLKNISFGDLTSSPAFRFLSSAPQVAQPGAPPVSVPHAPIVAAPAPSLPTKNSASQAVPNFEPFALRIPSDFSFDQLSFKSLLDGFPGASGLVSSPQTDPVVQSAPAKDTVQSWQYIFNDPVNIPIPTPANPAAAGNMRRVIEESKRGGYGGNRSGVRNSQSSSSSHSGSSPIFLLSPIPLVGVLPPANDPAFVKSVQRYLDYVADQTSV